MRVEQVRVLIVADVRLYRDGLVHALAGRESLTILGTAVDSEEALALVEALHVDVAVLDMTSRDSLRIARAIHQAAPHVKVVAFAVEESDREVLTCAEAGVAGYVPRGASADDLIVMIESVMRGELTCPPHTVSLLFRRLASLANGRDGPDGSKVTGREREILVLIDSGLSNKQIAQRLGIEVATVKNHVHHILEKLHVTSRSQAAALLRDRPGRASYSERLDESM
jgi:two-component system nitrate/nitrite response regulator NarL